ncbi:MAG: PatB family C-S lyase [Candidatus Dormibacteraeota bacterium]|nr:PatB family C-S lyase [Candidatus Dormibacteraeota bacterium]
MAGTRTARTFDWSEADLRSRRGIKWHRYGDSVLPAWVADMDCGVAEPVQRAIERMVARHDYGYPWRPEEDALAVAFADRMRTRFGWQPEPRLVLPVADLVQAVVAMLLAFTQTGQRVVLQTPIYPPFLEAIRSTGRLLAANPLLDTGARFELDTSDLRRQLDMGAGLLLVCNPHNPTGRVFSRPELLAIAEHAVEHDLVIVCDEIHADLVYAGAEHVAMAGLGPEIAARTVTITSATKSFNIPGLRCAVMHFGSEELRRRFEAAIPPRLLGSVNSVGVEATVAAWREGDAWLEGTLRHLARNRERVGAWTQSEALELGHHPPEATYLAWLDCRALDFGAATAQRFFLQRARVGLNAGEDFGPGGEGRVRLNFATSEAILEEVLGRLAGAIRSACDHR